MLDLIALGRSAIISPFMSSDALNSSLTYAKLESESNVFGDATFFFLPRICCRRSKS